MEIEMPLHLDLTQMRLESAPFRLQQYIRLNLPDWIQQTVMDEITAFANAAGAPPAFLSNVNIVKKGDFIYSIELDWFGVHGEPLGLWWENGTKKHIIKAVIANLLRWIDKKTGKKRYAKWVNHPGTKPHNIMKNAAKHGIPRLENLIITKTNQFLQDSRMR